MTTLTHPRQKASKNGRGRRRWIIAILTTVLAAIGTLGAAPAFAGTAAHGYGYTWSGDGSSFLGSYRVNGHLAYCDNVAALPATRFNYQSPD